MTDSEERAQAWLVECLPRRAVRLSAARNIQAGPEREVWDCDLTLDAYQISAILTIFKPGDLETVNTSLPPDLAAEKCFLAMSELPAAGIPAPDVLGRGKAGEEAAFLCEKILRTDWTRDTRLQAARILARLHNLQEGNLSERLRALARLSDPLESRTTRGEAPPGKTRTLVHGDYFSKNILPHAGGLCIIDWETFGWGDPMWDLGFLIGADRGLTHDEVQAVIRAYASTAAVDLSQLNWHRLRWLEFWNNRDPEKPVEPRPATQ